MPRCRSCKAEIVWAKTSTGRAMPFDAEPKVGGEWEIDEEGQAHYDPEGESRFTSHFATCPNAAEHRRAR
jgi:hypothetical protein